MKITLRHRRISVDPSTRPTTFGKLVAEIRLERQWSIRQLAATFRTAGCDSRWHLIESGKQLPTKKDVELVAELADLDYETLLAETETTYGNVSKNMLAGNPVVKVEKKKFVDIKPTGPKPYKLLDLQHETPEKMIEIINRMRKGKVRSV